MKKVSHILIPIYLIIALLHLIFVYLENITGIFATKPLLMSVLLVYLGISLYHNRSPFAWLIWLGFLFALFGDIALMLGTHHPAYDSGTQFLIGLVYFLLTHVFYLAAFLKYPRSRKERNWKSLILKFIPVLAFYVFFYWFFKDHLGFMEIPVFIYAAVICLMVLSALNLTTKTVPSVHRLIIAGALLFLISDFFIALNRFRPDVELPHPRLIIMTAYILGQYLIAKGSIRK